MSLWLLTHHRTTTWRLGKSLFGFEGELPSSPVGLIVGEAPGPNTDARTPLFPHPAHSAAGRLMQYGVMTPSEYLGRLERVNQCANGWSDYEATKRYRDILRWLLDQDPHPRVLLLGRQVQKIWGVHSPSGFGYERFGERLQVAWAMHPSGMNRVFNEQKNRDRLGRYVRWCAGLSTEYISSCSLKKTGVP